METDAKNKKKGECVMSEVLVELRLPYPPSGNHMWKHAGGNKHYLTDKARAYYSAVAWQVAAGGKALGLDCPLVVQCELSAPDKRKRDLENAWKVISDAITKAGVWSDDSKVRKLTIEWKNECKGGNVVVRIRQHEME